VLGQAVLEVGELLTGDVGVDAQDLEQGSEVERDVKEVERKASATSQLPPAKAGGLRNQ
jgi:hypothetical protein